MALRWTMSATRRIASCEPTKRFVASREMSPLRLLNGEATMETQLTHAARIQLARSLRRRYQAASSRAKKQI